MNNMNNMNDYNLDAYKMARNDFEDVNLHDAESDGSFEFIDVPTTAAATTVARGEELKKFIRDKLAEKLAELKKEEIGFLSKTMPFVTHVEAVKKVDKTQRKEFASFHREINKHLVAAEQKHEANRNTHASSTTAQAPKKDAAELNATKAGGKEQNLTPQIPPKGQSHQDVVVETPTAQNNIPSAESAILQFISTKSHSEIARLIQKINVHHLYSSKRHMEEMRQMQADCLRRCTQEATMIAEADDRKLGQFQDLFEQMMEKAGELNEREEALEKKREDMKDVTHEHEKTQQALMARALKAEGEVEGLKERNEKLEKERQVERERGVYYQGIIRRSREAELSVLRREGKPSPSPSQAQSQLPPLLKSSTPYQGKFTIVPASFIDECKRRVNDAETRARAAELRMRSAEKIVRNANEQLFEADEKVKTAEREKRGVEEKLRRAKEIAREMEAIIRGVKDKEDEEEDEEEEEEEEEVHDEGEADEY